MIDFSKTDTNIISLIPEIMDNEESFKINLEVILSLLYEQRTLKFFAHVSVVKNEKTNELKFNMGEIVEQIFSKLDKNFTSEFILSYYINEGNEKNDDDNKKYTYLGKINKDINQYQNLFLKIPEDKKIYLKLRQKLRKEKLFNPEYFPENESKHLSSLKKINLNEKEEKTEKIGGRGKEKTIEYVVLNVWMWNYIKNKNENLTLGMISDIIGCPKKTLYYYEKEICNGKKNGFNFNKNSKSKINVLIGNKRNSEV